MTQHTRPLGMGGRRTVAGLLLGGLMSSLSWAAAGDEPLADIMGEAGSAGLGAVMVLSRSPYVGGGSRFDLQPLYLYEGERLFVRADRIGLKFRPAENQRVGVFLRRRMEGFPSDEVPPALAGMARRQEGLDLGLSWRVSGAWGDVYGLLAQDIGATSRGTELELGYHFSWRRGPWTLRPGLGLRWRSAQLNNYYAGVRAEEATPERPAYAPGAGVDGWAGLYGAYALTERWRLLGGLALTLPSAGVRASPIVSAKLQPAVFLGGVYGFGSYKSGWGDEASPTIVRVFHGRATDDGCHLARIVTLRCADFNKTTPTRITGLYLGKSFVENFNDWPLDFVGFGGLVYHSDRPYQRNGLQFDLFMKAYYHGFPWSDRVKTRLGWGLGFSIAAPVPYDEVRSQAARDRPTSRMLNYLDPSIDLSLGDLIGHPKLRHTFIGLGVSHRSGIFAWSRLLGNVNGGSNYLYAYLEAPL